MGSHYGVKIRKLHDAATHSSKDKYACPRCGKKGVKRQGYGVWQCGSCKSTFAGGAYTPETMVGAAARRAVRQSTAKKVSAEE